MRSCAGADSNVAIPGHRRIAWHRTTLEPPNRHTLEVVFRTPSADRPVVRVSQAQIRHAYRRQAHIFANRGVWERKERIGCDLIRTQPYSPGQIGSHASDV